PVQPSVIVPNGWKVATALRPQTQAGGKVDYPVTSYEILMDSPLIAGAYHRQIPLSSDVFLDVIGDTPAELAATPEQIAAHKRLVEQAVKTFVAVISRIGKTSCATATCCRTNIRTAGTASTGAPRTCGRRTTIPFRWKA